MLLSWLGLTISESGDAQRALALCEEGLAIVASITAADAAALRAPDAPAAAARARRLHRDVPEFSGHDVHAAGRRRDGAAPRAQPADARRAAGDERAARGQLLRPALGRAGDGALDRRGGGARRAARPPRAPLRLPPGEPPARPAALARRPQHVGRLLPPRRHLPRFRGRGTLAQTRTTCEQTVGGSARRQTGGGGALKSQ